MVAGERLTLTGATISGTDAGTYTTVGEYSWSVVKADGTTDSTGNYTINVTGQLTIVADGEFNFLDVDALGYNGTYDANSHTGSEPTTNEQSGNTTYKYSTDGGATWTDAQPSVTDVRDGLVNVIVEASNPNYTNKPRARYTLKVNPVKITAYLEESKPYTGSEQSIDIKDGTKDGLVTGETLTLAGATIRGTEAGEYTTVSQYTWSVVKADKTTDSTANYEIEVSGKLTITPGTDLAILNVNALGYNGTYDANSHSGNQPTTNAKSGNTTYKYSTDGGATWIDEQPSITDVNEGPITVTVKASNPNYANEPTTEYTLTVTPAEITAHLDTSRRYTGTEQSIDIAEGAIVGVVSGETLTLKGATISGTEVGEYTTVSAYEWTVVKKDRVTTSKGNYTIQVSGKLTITDDNVSDDFVITKTHTAGTYKLGDTITFKISVTNIYNATKTITLNEQAGVTFENGKTSMTLELAAGETRTVEAKYVLTEADIVYGTFTNTVTASVGDKTFTAKDTVSATEIADANPYLKITKVVESEDSTEDSTKIYKLDEVVKYKITVKNAGNLTLTNVKVEDKKTGLNETIQTLKPNETREFTTSYQIKEKDVRNGKFDNVATGSANNPSDKKTKVDEGEATIPTEKANSSLYVEKIVTNASEDGFAEGDEIIFNIHVINNGNQTITGIAITDALVGNTGDNTLKVKDLKPGEDDTVTVKYTVTQNDLVNGSVKNEAKATGTDPSNKTVTAKDDATATTVETNPSLVVKKDTISQPANGSTYALGETIRYRITVTNTGNLDLTNVKIIDTLANVEKVNPKDWTIAKLAVGDSKSVEATYTVTKADILNGEVVNAALAEADSPDRKEPKVEGDQTVDQTDAQNPHMTVVKTTTSNPQNGTAYALGETITYKITVTNDGNVDLTNVKVIDNKEGLVKHGAGLLTRDWPTLTLLAVGQTREFTASYTVTQNDLIAGNVVNDATATGTAPGDNEPTVVPGNTDDSTEKANADYTVTKTVDNPKAEYKVGDVINYTIRITNTGNLTLNNLTVADQMQGASGNAVIANKAGVTVNGNTATIATLAVGASIELKASYTVARADADGTLANRVNVTSTTKPGEDPENPNGPTTPSKSGETDPTPTEKTYALTIHYVDNNGNAAAPDYTARLLAGETIDAVVSPAIDGYTPNFGTVVLPATGMPAANITVTVIYTPDGPDEVLDDPENPNQPNNGGNNGGGNAVNNNNNNANNANNADNGNNAANNNAGQADANPAPADGVIQPDDNGGYDLTPVEDTPTPLANMNLDDHACCILHFLIMLLTLIIFALYTKSRKNRQLKVEELREQLAIASIQKELDLSDEDMAKYLEEAKKLAEEKKQANA